MRPLRITLVIIGVVQVFFGLPFVVAPGLYSVVLHLSSAPAWTTWFFVMNGARFLAMGYGMFLAYNLTNRKLAKSSDMRQ